MTESTDPVRAALSIPVHIDTLMQLDGRVAVVTETSSGLGQRFARVLDAAGASVILASRRHDADVELAAALRDALAVRCDVRSPTDRQTLVATAIQRFGGIDILINNAGIAHSEPAETEPEERVRQLLVTNLVSLYPLTQLIVSRVKKVAGFRVVQRWGWSGWQGRDVPPAAGSRTAPRVVGSC